MPDKRNLYFTTIISSVRSSLPGSENSLEIDKKVLLINNLLKEISKIEDYPALSSNAKRALGVVWQMVNHLGLDFEQQYDFEV